jgi:transposase
LSGWPVKESFAFHPAIKDQTLRMGANVFMGLSSDDPDAQLLNDAFRDQIVAAVTVIRKPLPFTPFRKGLKAREVLVRRFHALVEERRNSDGEDFFTRMCHAKDEDGKGWSDQEIVEHFNFMMMAAHDTTASALTTMIWAITEHPQWQDRLLEEVAALPIAERWILARLRNQRFFGLDEVNAAIRPLLDQLNCKMSRHLGASRRNLFERLDKPALKPLPVAPYVFAEWKQCRAGLDYHVDVDRHYYSVPHQLLKQKLWVRTTARTVEIFHKGQRVASHARTSGNRQHSTIRDHMPAHHRFREDWTPERIRRQAARIGPNVEAFVEVVMRQRKHPEQGYRTCLGTLRLAKTFGKTRLDSGCERALEINAHSYSSLHSILKNGLDRQRREPTTDGPAITHPNIRGAGYFH